MPSPRWISVCVISLLLMSIPVAPTAAHNQHQSIRPEMLIRQFDGEHWQFRHITRDGTTTDLLQDAPAFQYLNFLMVSPDKQWVYFGAPLPEDAPLEFALEASWPQRVYRVAMTGGVPEVIVDTPCESAGYFRPDLTQTNGVVPTPDGEYIVYKPSEPDANGWRGLWRIRSDGTDPIELSAGVVGKEVRSFEWTLSEDGQWVYFGVDQADAPVYPVYRARMDGTAPPELLTEIEYPGVWSIAGNWVLESGTRERAVSLTDGTDKILSQEGVYSATTLVHAFPEQDIAIWQTVLTGDYDEWLEAVRLTDGTPLWNLWGATLEAVIKGEWLILGVKYMDMPPRLIRMRPDGSEQTILIQGWTRWLDKPLVAGEWLILSPGGEQNNSLWGVHSMTGERRLIWENPIPDSSVINALAASSDGAWLVYEFSPDGDSDATLQLMSLGDDAVATVELAHGPSLAWGAAWFLE